MTQNIRIVKREIRILGLDACRTNTVFGAVVRGGLYVDGLLSIAIINNPDNRKIARAIRESRYFPELRAIMIHDPDKRLRPPRLEKLTGLPVLHVLGSRARGWKAHHTGRGTLWIKTRLPDQTAEKILSITWAFEKLPEPLRIAHLFAKTRFPKDTIREEKAKFAPPGAAGS